MARIQGSFGENTILRIRQAALKLFANSGYSAVPVRDIAKSVGLQAGALYNYFPNKQAILMDLLDRHMSELLSAWELESKNYSDPKQALEGFVRFHIQFHKDKQDEVFISYMELRNLEMDNFKTIEAKRRIYEGYLRKIISSGNKIKIFDVPDVPVASTAIISMLAGMNTWFNSRGRLGVDEVETIYVKMILASVSNSSNDQDIDKRINSKKQSPANIMDLVT